MSLQTPFPRQVALGSRGAEVSRDADGRYLMHASEPLAPYPERITEWLVHWAREAPERTFVAKRGADGAWLRLSYGDALVRARTLAAGLLRRGLSAERPLMILSENDLEHALLKLAALHAGVPYVPVSPAYALVSRDFARLRDVMRTLTPGLVFAADATRFAAAITATVPRDVELAVTTGSLSDRPVTAFAELSRAHADDDAAVARAHAAIDPDAVCQFLMTSGSTGTPKAVIQTQRMLSSNQQMIAQCLPCLAARPPVLVDWLPWHHIFGGNHNFGIVLRHGGTLYIDEGKPAGPQFAATLRNLRELPPTAHFAVPRAFEELANALERDASFARGFFSQIDFMFHAGAGLSQRLRERFEALSRAHAGRHVLMLTGLGMTETSPFALSAHWETRLANEVGVPASGVTLRLAPVGDKLEARYRGPSVTPGFWRDPELTRRAFDEDGFYCSGDAVTFLDPSAPERGLLFDGRLAEDFKLDSGTWVSVGPLRERAIFAGAPLVQDVVPTGRDQPELGMLIVPNLEACRRLAELPAEATTSAVLADARVREGMQALLDALAAQATGSATSVTRALVLATPLSIDRGEVTDKGSLVQQAILRTQAALVARLHADDADDDPEIVRPRRPDRVRPA